MGGMISDGLFLPALILASLAFAVPRLLARVLPEGVAPLLLNAFAATVLLFLISSMFFAGLYLWQGAPFDRIIQTGWAATMLFFGKLGLMAAIIWAPIMVLSVAGLPRHWVKETW